MGAKVTGVDLSDKAISEARRINDELSLNARFINCDLYSLPEHLDEQFDMVFTTYGTIGWLPDLDEWAGVVDRFLKPGGRFVFVEFHPVVWMHNAEFTEIEYSYFKRAAIIEMENGSYANRQAPSQMEYISWNHSLDEPITALLTRGLQLRSFREYPFSPYKIFETMTEVEKGRYCIKGLEDKLPLIYSLEMIKPKGDFS
jgi:SAM-dependent methyltransferase